MKKLIALVLAVITVGIVIASEETPAKAGACLMVPPICSPGYHPVCICSGPFQCSWTCSY